MTGKASSTGYPPQGQKIKKNLKNTRGMEEEGLAAKPPSQTRAGSLEE